MIDVSLFHAGIPYFAKYQLKNAKHHAKRGQCHLHALHDTIKRNNKIL